MDLSTPETTEEELGRVQAAIQDFGPDAPKWLLLREKELENPTLSTSAKQRAAIEAVRAIGTNGLQTLLKDLQARDSALKLGLARLAREHFAVKMPFRWADERGGQALIALEALGTRAKPALPELISMLSNGESAYLAIAVMSFMGPDGVQPLTIALTNADRRIRLPAAFVLRQAAPGGPIASEAHRIIPPLLACLADNDAQMRGQAISSLGTIGKAPEIVVPALTGCLADKADSNRRTAAIALARFGARAKHSIPRLLALTNDPNAELRKSAVKAIAEIEER